MHDIHNVNEQRRMLKNVILRPVVVLMFGLLLQKFENLGATALTTSYFHGRSVTSSFFPKNPCPNNDSKWYMRKQKASNRRTRRLQQNRDTIVEEQPTFTRSPMADAVWSYKMITSPARQEQRKHHNGKKDLGGGRNRSMKRSNYYNTISNYHNHFQQLLTAEYKYEEDVVLSRLRRSVDDPLALEAAGHALLDMEFKRCGILFNDEVYRFTKAQDASSISKKSSDHPGYHKLPSACQLAKNDVVIITHQPNGSGDFFGAERLPIDEEITTIEGRVLNRGPTYVDIAFVGGAMVTIFGISAEEKQKASKLRVRLDRFFSNVPYTRMVSGLNQLTGIERRHAFSPKDTDEKEHLFSKIAMDPLLRDIILHSFVPSSPELSLSGNGVIAFDDKQKIYDFAKRCAKPPLRNSVAMTNEVLQYMQSNPHHLFPVWNQPQLNAIGAALTRRLTLLQGPPGTGKTTVGASIAFGFVHQCRNIAPGNTKVLACAFSNVGADNFAEQLIQLGLKVVRIGKASTAISESLWGSSLDAAIHADPEACSALRMAATATAQLKKSLSSQQSLSSKSSKRAAATAAVKASIQACNVAATKAFREADVIVSTCIGAADPRLLAACGIASENDVDNKIFSRKWQSQEEQQEEQRQLAPDGKPPISLPFVLIDEACQSVEPATLIPLVSSNSCRSLVLFGDPCQLPPTVLASNNQNYNSLTLSLMERLSICLPPPSVVSFTQNNSPIMSSLKDVNHLRARPTQQALSIFRSRQQKSEFRLGATSTIYRKRFGGALLLSVQYRMHPSIAAFSSAIFYDSLLSTPSFLKKYRQLPFPRAFFSRERRTTTNSFNKEGNLLDWHIRFVHVGGRCNEQKGTNTILGAIEENTSYSNPLEADEVMQIVQKIVKDESFPSNNPLTIGIVTPYKAQVKLIQQRLNVAGVKNEIINEIVEVKSVDAYQGRERDIVIVSTVRSNHKGKIGFLADWRRLNVAWTRAKHGLIMVGDYETLNESRDPYWGALVKYFQASQSMVVSSNDINNISNS